MKENSNLILYKASAGSGKTYTLAKEFIKILTRNPYDYNKILAVTFTKKATAEMKTRIVEYLSLLGKNDASVADLKYRIIEEIQNEKAIDVSDVFEKNIQTALQLILHNYAHFNISTIDSFFQSIIRAFAKELDLPIGMEVELDTENVVQQAVQALLKEYKTDSDTFSKWIEEYVFDLIEEDKSWKIEKNIFVLANQLLKEEYQLLVQDKHTFEFEDYRKALTEIKKIISSYKQRLDALVQHFEQQIQQQAIDLSIFKGKTTITSFVKKTKNYEPEFLKTIQEMLDTDVILPQTSAKDMAIKMQAEQAWFTYVKPFLLEVQQHQLQNERSFNAAVLVQRNIYSLALLEFINTKIKEYKAENDLILISDTNQIVSLISKHEEIPFIFEKSANFLNYILIDEFQDTSTLQWNGLLPLLLEILQKIHGIVLIVGDPKQSIYRWRGGKMELIIDGIQDGMPHHWRNRKDEPLTTNFRSAKEIVEFNNAFFTAVKNEIKLDSHLFENVLADVQQGNKKSNQTGFVHCKWLAKNTKKEGVEQNEEDPHLLELLAIIQSLEKTHNYGDIAVLTRTNIQGAIVANFLQEKNIPVVSAESLLLQTHPSIKLLIAALEYVLHYEEVFYKTKLNYQYACFFNKNNPAQYLSKEHSIIDHEIPFLKLDTIRTLSSIAINELVFLLFEALNLDVQNNNYLLRFQDVVFKYVQQHTTSLREFLNYWEEKKEKLSILPPEGLDAVKIYTIHKSKGLQFPIVILPFAHWSMTPKTNSTIWLKSDIPPFNQLRAFPVELQKKLENSLFEDAYKKEVELTYIDNVNMVYVAFTRPEEQLYILADEPKPTENELPSNVSVFISRILKQLSTLNTSNDKLEFTFGINNTATEKKKNSFELMSIKPHKYNNFKQTIKLNRKKQYNEAQAKGNILHEILFKINQPHQIEKAVAMTTHVHRDIYLQEAAKIIQFFNEKNWFDEKWENINERDVYFKNEILRPDKVLLSDEQCVIIDFKTGAKKKEHAQQLKLYKEAYSQIIKQKIQTFLLYTDTLELQEV
jgi:ATP-dependent helicase/nuclease subunit A